MGVSKFGGLFLPDLNERQWKEKQLRQNNVLSTRTRPAASKQLQIAAAETKTGSLSGAKLPLGARTSFLSDKLTWDERKERSFIHSFTSCFQSEKT